MKSETLYIGIKEDDRIRRELLTSSKTIISILQEMSQSAQLKDTKIQKLKELQKIRDEIKFLNKKIRTKMPAAETTKTPTRKIKNNKKYTIQELEKELEKIEQKLEKLE